MGNGITYRNAGVDIDAGNALVEAIKPLAKATARAGTEAGLGGFGAFFDPKRAGFRDPILVATTDGVGTKLKIAYVVPESAGNEADATQLRAFLRTKLPEYMIPASFVFLDAMPLTPNGKVDRKALPVLSQDQMATRAEYVAPRTEEEQAIAAICAEVLNLDRVGVHDNFFDLGGNSLIATRLIFQLQEHFQVRLPLVRLFESPTIEGLALAIADARTMPMAEDMYGTVTLDQLKNDVTLDESIHTNGIREPGAAPKRILITGATGFLGAYLLKGLLDKTDAQLSCLIRAENANEGLRRLTGNLEYYEIWDDAYLLYHATNGPTVTLWAYSVKEQKASRFDTVTSPLLTLPGAVFSPDGSWVAYASREGRASSAVYVEPFPATGAKYQISSDAEDGHHPAWSPDGRQLFYTPGGVTYLHAVSIATNAGFTFSDPERLPRPFSNRIPGDVSPCDVARDGRFLALVEGEGGTGVLPYHVVVNWFEELTRRVPVR